MIASEQMIEAVGIFAVCIVVVCSIAAIAACETFKARGLPDDEGDE